MSRRLNTGVVGVSTWHGVVQQLEKYLECPGACVVAVSDADPMVTAAVAKKCGIGRHFAGYRDLLAVREIEAVGMGRPPGTHPAITCDAAAAGRHMLWGRAVSEEQTAAMVRFKEGPVKLEFLEPETFIHCGQQEDMQTATSVDVPRPTENVAAGFVKACLHNGTPKTLPEEGLRTMQIMTKSYESSTLGREVIVEN